MSEGGVSTSDLTDSQSILDSQSVSGELCRLPSAPALRLLETLSLVLVFRALAQLLGRTLLSYRAKAKLELDGSVLQLKASHRLFGQEIRRSERHFFVNQLVELALDEQGEDPRFYVGFSALFVGTALGAWLLTDALTTQTGSLLIAGALVLGTGLALDYWVASGRRPTRFVGPAQLSVRTQGGGFTLTGVSLDASRRLIAKIQSQIGSEASSDAEFRSNAPLPTN